MTPARAWGFGLVENLAALVVLSIGLLGTAALIGSALAALRAALQRQIAIVLTDEMTSRLLGPGRATAAATGELAQWQLDVERRLPRGNGRVTRAQRGRIDVVTIDVSWDEPGLGTLHHAVEVAVAP